MKAVKEFKDLMKMQGYSDTTTYRYSMALENYITYWADKGVQLKDLTWTHLRDWKKDKVANNNITPVQLTNELRGIKGYYKLKAEDTLSKKWMSIYSKMMMIKAPKVRKTLGHRAMKYDVLMDLLDKTKEDDDLHLLAMTLLYTGGRAQIYGLHKDNIDFKRGVITLIVKGNKELDIPLHDDLAPLLKKRIAQGTFNGGFIFKNGRYGTSARNQQNNWYHCYMQCKKMGKLIGNGEIHPHRFRKTLATLGKKLKIDLQTMQKILGHANISITADIYTELEMEEIKGEYGKVSFIHKDKDKESKNIDNLISRIKALSKEDKQKVILALMEG